jgi:M6 family metalloprotease-like protein
MKKVVFLFGIFFPVFFLSAIQGCKGSQVIGPQEEKISSPLVRESQERNILGPQSTRAKGEIRLLIAVAQFPDVQPRVPLRKIERTVVQELNDYVKDQSYGQAWVNAQFMGYVSLRDSISAYRISPNNFEVDRGRVRKLIEDTMTATESRVDFSQYQNMLIIPAAMTQPGKGYGMMCYCANPGMLTGVRGNPRYVTLRSKGGKEFSGGVFVGTENAPLGMFAHDFFHALGGVSDNKRLVPCLYNFERQAEASRLHKWEVCTDYMGTWDVMSAHYVGKGSTPGISSFTRIRLGWISSEQAILVRSGEEKIAFLAPLAKGGKSLVLKIILPKDQYYLLESRQLVGVDKVQPDSGILILRVNPAAQEGIGTVRIMDADPSFPNLSRATFRLDQENRKFFVDKENNVAVIPLWGQGENQGVLVTTAPKGQEALQATLMIQKLLQRYPEPRSGKGKQQVEECLEAFERFDFQKSYQIAKRAF